MPDKLFLCSDQFYKNLQRMIIEPEIFVMSSEYACTKSKSGRLCCSNKILIVSICERVVFAWQIKSTHDRSKLN